MRVRFVDRDYWNSISWGDTTDSFTLNIEYMDKDALRNMLSSNKWDKETDCEYSYYEWVCETLDKNNIKFTNVENYDMMIDW